MIYYTVTLRLEGAPAAAVAVEWTNRPAPLDATGWEPCLRLADGTWRFSSRASAAPSAPHRREPGPFADLAIRYRLEPAGPWSAPAEPRKEIVILQAREDGTLEPLQIRPALLAAPALVGSGEIGGELMVEPGLWSGIPTPALAFQWRRDGADLPGAMARAHPLGAADDGCEIACAVTATNAAGALVATAGPVRARRAPPRRVGDLPEEVFDEGTGLQAVETAFAFAGEALVFTAEGAAIDPMTGVLSVPTDAPVAGAVVRVTATNSGGSAAANLAYTVEAAPLVVLGVPVIATSGIAGTTYQVTWPIPNRSEPSERRLTRLYAAATGGAPLATSPASGVLPIGQDGRWFSLYYTIFDSVTNLLIERESPTRVRILPAVSPSAIAPDNVTFFPIWVDPAKRTLVRAEVDVVGVGAGDALQWRIDTARVNGEWQDCPVASGTRRALGLAPRPAHLPGDHPLGHFDDDEERFSIRFRKKIAANAWSEPSPKLRLDPPDAYRPTVTVSTAQQLRDAVVAGTANGVTDFFVIHVAADISFGGQSSATLSMSNRNKQGHPLVIRSADAGSPRTFRSWRDDFMTLTNCSNIVLQGLRWQNDQTESAGGVTGSGVAIPYANVNTGTALKIDGCQRVAIVDCTFHKHKFGVSASRVLDCYVGFNEFTGTSNDSLRLLGGGVNTLVESCHFHSQEPHPDPNIYEHDSGTWHTDCIQAAHHSTWGGHTNLRIRNCRAHAVGTFSGFLVVEKDTPFWHEGVTIENCFYKGTSQSGISLRVNRNTIVSNCVIRETSPVPPDGSKRPRVRIGNRTENVLLSDVVTAYSWQVQEADAGGGETAIRAQVAERNVVTSQTAWPATWPAGATEVARESAYPAGPGAYRVSK